MMSTITNPKEKKLSKCWRAFKKVKPSPKVVSKSRATPPPYLEPTRAHTLIQLINADLNQMRRGAAPLQAARDQLTLYHEMLIAPLIKLDAIFEKINDDEDNNKKVATLNRLRKKLNKMKLEIPFVVIRKPRLSLSRRVVVVVPETGIPRLHGSPALKTSMEFMDFEARFHELEERIKLCLLCFSIFPQGAPVKKRLMLQWWLVEGFASNMQQAESYFKMLVEKGFVEDVEGGSCGILHPFHRWVVVALAERANLFDFGCRGDPTQSFLGSLQAYLTGEGLMSDYRRRKEQAKGGGDKRRVIKEMTKELKKLHFLMNMGEESLKCMGEWFGKMENLNFLHLGRWKAATGQIEVDGTMFLEGLEKMKFLKFLSLQGVCNMILLPPSILHLTNLEVLDLRDCSYLECIPERIYLLQKLRHLDMSGCYRLHHMPKGLSDLKHLKVLKGFFVTKYIHNSCTLGDLQKLKYLEKLCIYTDWKDFPGEEHMLDLEKLMSLTKLTITWGVGKEEAELAQPPVKKGKLPLNLEKLDLECFPKAHTPNWLRLENMEGIELKKLYIRGGKLRDLGQYQYDDCEMERTSTVEELRLNYLGEMEMEWRQLRGLFPKLKYVEKVSCPKLTLFPCDAKGVWRSTQE